MGSICFSAATILRCTALAPLQNVALLIPTVVEVLCTSMLVFKHKNTGRKHLLLTAEGWIYFVLSVLQMISGVVPAVRDNISNLRAFDTGIGVASFLPLFFYTFFFFIFTSNELLETLPKGLMNIAKYSLVLFIPAIVVFNEIASFTGVIIREAPPVDAPGGSPTIQFFFLDKRSDLLWAFFTSLTLALLVAFQAAVFSFAFFRDVRAILNQRRIENKGSDKAHMFNGIVWLCAGIKIGALESLVGLFGGGFGIALTRRIMRMMSRACITVGIAKGVDIMEDFRIIQRELRTSNENRRGQRRSRLMEFISNPRMSTFRQLSPTATSFHASTRGAFQPSVMEKDEAAIGQHPHYITFSQRQSMLSNQGGLPGMRDFALVREERLKRRVTVLQMHEEAPKLQMRFSVLEVPAPALISSDVKMRPQSELFGRPTTTNLTYAAADNGKAEDEKVNVLQPPQPHFHGGSNGSERRESYNSSLGSPYEIVDARKLTQTIAVGQLYRPQAMRTPSSAREAAATTTVSGQLPANPPGLPETTDGARVKSMVSTKTNSITAAVRDLADQFPGPPDVSKTRPVVVDNDRARQRDPAFGARNPRRPAVPLIEEKSAWEEDSRISAVYFSATALSPQAVGTPSALSHNDHTQQPGRLGLPLEDDRAYSSENSPLAFAPPSPAVKGGKALVTQPDYRMSTASRKSRRSEKATTTVSDEDYGPSRTPVSAPLGVPLQKSLKLSVAATPVPVIRRYSNRSPLTPTTGLSILSRIQESVAPNQVDPFSEHDMALDTGKSRNFRDEVPPMPQPPPSSSRASRFKSEEKLNRVAEWLDRSARLTEEHMDPEAPPTMEELSARPPIVPSPRENSLQNLHERGKSIDALTIPWVKTPELAEARATATATTTGRATTASYEATVRMVGGPRIKTVGKAPSRSTPKPTRTNHSRVASLYLQPIIIPPRSGNMPQIENDASPTELEDSNVLRDSEVLVIENAMRPRQGPGRF